MLFETRRALGAFYTPADLATLVASWAIDRAGLKILEPSVGSGALLDAILKRVTIFGGGSVEGFEIDPATVSQLSRFAGDSRVRLKRADFFDVRFDSKFDLVIANPPFTRNHALKPSLRRQLKDRHEIKGIASGAAGLWIYFLLASVPLLQPGGRLVFLVPRAAEFVDYAKPAFEHLCKQFASVELIAIDSPISWEGEAQERAVVVIASDFKKGCASHVQTRRAKADGSFLPGHNPETGLPTADHVTLGNLASLEIGSVTSANDIFLFSKELASDAGLSERVLTPVISRARHVTGVSVRSEDLRQLAIEGHRTLLLTPERLGPKNGAVCRHLSTVTQARRENTVWLMKRSPWWKVQLGRPFDGVLTYMNHKGPRLALL